MILTLHLFGRGWVAQYIQVNNKDWLIEWQCDFTCTDRIIHFMSICLKTWMFLQRFQRTYQTYVWFHGWEVSLTSSYLSCFSVASMLQSINSCVVWKRGIRVLWHDCWILGRETFQMKEKIVLSHKQVIRCNYNNKFGKPSGVQHKVAEVLI